MTTLTFKVEVAGEWKKGKWIDGEIIEKQIEGVCMPFTSQELKNFPEGYVSLDDKDLKTYSSLEENTKVRFDGKLYKVCKGLDYGYLADIKNYILKEVKE